jgi:hypothetical protein
MFKLKYGAMGVQRNGQEVGPFEPSGNRVFPFAWGGQIWREDGTWEAFRRTSDYDIVRVFAAPAAEPSPVDLTQITTPLKYLPPETVAALKAHKGPVEWLNADGEWKQLTNPIWYFGHCYRAKPAPAPKPEPRKPREVWWSIDWNGQWHRCEFSNRKQAEAFSLKTGHEVILFREVIDDVVESLPSC